jgi:hypothetical protein
MIERLFHARVELLEVRRVSGHRHTSSGSQLEEIITAVPIRPDGGYKSNGRRLTGGFCRRGECCCSVIQFGRELLIARA